MKNMPMYPGAMTTTEFFRYHCRKLGELAISTLIIIGGMSFLFTVLCW